MDALIAKIAISRWPDPMPIIVEPLARQRLLRRGAAPKVVVNARGNWLRAVHFANTGPSFITEAARADDFSQMSFVHPGNPVADAVARAGLGARLHDAIVPARRIYELPAFPD